MNNEENQKLGTLIKFPLHRRCLDGHYFHPAKARCECGKHTIDSALWELDNME